MNRSKRRFIMTGVHKKQRAPSEQRNEEPVYGMSPFHAPALRLLEWTRLMDALIASFGIPPALCNKAPQ